MYNKGAKSSGKVVAPNKLWHAFKHKNFDVFKREFVCSVLLLCALRNDWVVHHVNERGQDTERGRKREISYVWFILQLVSVPPAGLSETLLRKRGKLYSEYILTVQTAINCRFAAPQSCRYDMTYWYVQLWSAVVVWAGKLQR